MAFNIDMDAIRDAAKFSKAEGLLGYLRSEGFTVNRLKTGHGIVVGPASRSRVHPRAGLRTLHPQGERVFFCPTNGKQINV